MIGPEVHKVTRAQVGGVTEPGRYLFTFGWLTITEADLKVWKRFPDASFTLVAEPGRESAEESGVGAFVPGNHAAGSPCDRLVERGNQPIRLPLPNPYAT